MKTKQDQEELGTQIIVEAVSLYPKSGGTAERHFICGQNLFSIFHA
jgi:hypothetical protein